MYYNLECIVNDFFSSSFVLTIFRFCIFSESTSFKMCDVFIDITAHQMLLFRLRIMCHNYGTWHDSAVVSFTSEESCQWTNYKTKYTLESPDPLGNNCVSLTGKQLCQTHFGTFVLVSLGKHRTSLTWKQSCQCRLGNRGTIIGKNDNNIDCNNINININIITLM